MFEPFTFSNVGKIMMAKYRHLMAPWVLQYEKAPDIDFTD